MPSISLGGLALEGTPALGALESIANPRLGWTVALDASQRCWDVDIEHEGRVQTAHADQWRAEALSSYEGAFHHLSTGVRLGLQWRPLGEDAVVARLSFTAGPPDAIVRRVQFRLSRAVNPGQPDALVYPYCAGIRVDDPATELFEPARSRQAKWKDRSLAVHERGFDLEEDDGAVVFSHDYSGRCSMAWMDYAGPKGGVYLAAHDPGLEHAILAVRARRGSPGLEMWIEKKLNRALASWSCDFVLGLHDGDWRRGADIYRAWFHSAFAPIRSAPDFIRHSPGVACHYDFKWQDGSIGHHFRDLPGLLEESAPKGFSNLLVAGWNVDGFDASYPLFRPDPDLGTEEDLRQAVAEVHEKGGKVFFYVNTFSFDTSHPEYESLGRPGAVKSADGEPLLMRWGTHDMAGMCKAFEPWRRRVLDNIRYVIEDLGADGVYADQLAVRPQMCSDPAHNHTQAWVAANVDLVAAMRATLGNSGRRDAVLFSEWITDALATQLDFQLCHTVWMAGLAYAFPEMFRYTFPEATLIDQVFQKPWPGDPPEVEEDHLLDTLGRLFVTGILFWAYDHLFSNRRQRALLDGVLTLRAMGLDYFAEGEFMDEPALSAPLPQGVCVKMFRLAGRGSLLAVWNRTGSAFDLELAEPLHGSLLAADLDGTQQQSADAIDRRRFAGSASPLSIIIVGK